MRTTTIAIAILLAACGGSSATGDDTAADPDAAGGADPDARPGTDPDADPGAPDAAPATDPGELGPYVVTVTTASTTTSLGTASLTVYRPAGDGPFPLVVVSTGFQITRSNYDVTCRHIASWGYLVVSHDYTSGNHDEKAAEISELIDWALGAQPVDATRIATAGHSMGGKVSILAAIEDPRVGAVVGWDPVDALPPFSDGSTSVAPERIDELTRPIAVIGETGDSSCAPAADNYQQYFDGACAAPAALEVTIEGADHTDWVDSRASCGFACLVCAQGATEDATVLEISRRVTVAWLEVHLRGRDEMAPWFSVPGIGSPVSVQYEPPCP